MEAALAFPLPDLTKLPKEHKREAKPCKTHGAAHRYLVVVIFMVAVTWDGAICFWESLCFFGLYGAYLAAVLLPRRMDRAFAWREGFYQVCPNSGLGLLRSAFFSSFFFGGGGVGSIGVLGRQFGVSSVGATLGGPAGGSPRPQQRLS